MAGKQRPSRIVNSAMGELKEVTQWSAPLPQVERAVRPELMHFDLNGQRARDLEIIRLLEEISSKLDGK